VARKVIPSRKHPVVVYNPPFQFLVYSDSHPRQPNLVDLVDNSYNGFCSCPDYEYVKGPSNKVGDEFRCKHIKQARSYFLDEVLPKINEQLNSHE